MQKIKEQLLLSKEDREIILSYLQNSVSRTTFNRHEAEDLKSELNRAKIVKKDSLPKDVVRLNSTVRIREEEKGKEMKVTIVTPEKADIKLNRISVMSPVGTALIGFREGQLVSWNVPSGKKQFTIMEVQND